MTQIRDLTRREDPRGRAYFTATIVDGDAHVPVDNRWGSWTATVATDSRPVMPGPAADLQAAVKTLLRREKEQS